MNDADQRNAWRLDQIEQYMKWQEICIKAGKNLIRPFLIWATLGVGLFLSWFMGNPIWMQRAIVLLLALRAISLSLFFLVNYISNQIEELMDNIEHEYKRKDLKKKHQEVLDDELS